MKKYKYFSFLTNRSNKKNHHCVLQGGFLGLGV